MRYAAFRVPRWLLVLGGLLIAAGNATADVVDFEDLIGTGLMIQAGSTAAAFSSSTTTIRLTIAGAPGLTPTPPTPQQRATQTSTARIRAAPTVAPTTACTTSRGQYRRPSSTSIPYPFWARTSPTKKFGGATGDDPDWFLLTITGKDSSDAVTGTVDFYLADYRFDDNSLDYIVDEWTWVDLTSLGGATKLEFDLDSSDVGTWGMNTPAYFAMDDLHSVPEPSTLAIFMGGGLVVGAISFLRRRRFLH